MNNTGILIALGVGALILLNGQYNNPSNKIVGGKENDHFLQNRYDPPGPINGYNLSNPLPDGDSQGTFINTDVSTSNNPFTPANSQTPHVFDKQQASIVGVNESLIETVYGNHSRIVQNSEVSPTSYNYNAGTNVAIIDNETFPTPQYVLAYNNRPLIGENPQESF
jgi:hypothetical protein